jgi:hypothetical protein
MSNTLQQISNNISNSSKSIPINLPGMNMEITGSLLALCPECDREMKKAAAKVNEISAKINTVVNQAYCMGMLLTDPSALLKAVNMMGTMVTAMAKNLAKRMTDLIAKQIQTAITTISGSINGAVENVKTYLKALSDFLNQVQNTYKALKNFKLNLKVSAKADKDDFASLEDCEFAFAMLAACLVNRLVGKKLKKLEEDVSNKIKKERSRYKCCD